MPQTLLTLLGIVFLGVTFVQAGQAHIETRAVAGEVSEMGIMLGNEVMKVIRSRAFDQAVTERKVKGTIDDLELFTFVDEDEHFPVGKACSVFRVGYDACDDIDDFHRMKTARLPFVIGLDTVFFDVDVEVEYVDADGRRSDTPTFEKRITLAIQDAALISGGRGYLRKPLHLSHVHSYSF